MEEHPDDSAGERFVLRLFISGMTPRSTEAIIRTKAFCDRHLTGRYELEVIDIYQQPTSAKEEQIVATPTLLRVNPPPIRRLVGDLSNEERVFHGLGLHWR